MNLLNLETNANIISMGLMTVSFLVVGFFAYHTRYGYSGFGSKNIKEVEDERNNAIEMNRRLMHALSAETREMLMEEGEKGFMRSIQRMAEKNGVTGTSMHLDQSVYLDAKKNNDMVSTPQTKAKKPEITRKSAGKTPEYDKADFHFSSINLLMGYLSGNGNWIYNPNLQESIFLLSKQDFFLKFQTFLSTLVKTKMYEINGESLRKIKQAIWSGDVRKIVSTINTVNQLDIFASEYDATRITGDRIFSKILTSVVGSDCYRIFKEEDRRAKEEKDNLYRGLNTKRSQKKKGEMVVFTTEDAKIEENIRQDIAIIKEIDGVVGKGFAEFIGLDIDDRILKLRIENSNIFSKKVKTLIEYYKRNGNLTKIIFYL